MLQRHGFNAQTVYADSGWLKALQTLDFDRLSRNAQVDYLFICRTAETQIASANLKLYRIGDRNIASLLTASQFLTQLDGYSAQRIQDENGEMVWQGSIDIATDLIGYSLDGSNDTVGPLLLR